MAFDDIGRSIIKGIPTDGRKTVTAAGTAEALSSTSLLVDWIIIVAETDNTGVMAVGAPTVVATVLTRRGVPLNAGDVVTLSGIDLKEIYLDTTVSGDGVTYFYRV